MGGGGGEEGREGRQEARRRETGVGGKGRGYRDFYFQGLEQFFDKGKIPSRTKIFSALDFYLYESS